MTLRELHLFSLRFTLRFAKKLKLTEMELESLKPGNLLRTLCCFFFGGGEKMRHVENHRKSIGDGKVGVKTPGVELLNHQVDTSIHIYIYIAA